jgi:hypothetical protein
MAHYTLPITIEASSQAEAEQKLQQLIQAAALPKRTAVTKAVGSILFEMLDYYMTKKLPAKTTSK